MNTNVLIHSWMRLLRSWHKRTIFIVTYMHWETSLFITQCLWSLAYLLTWCQLFVEFWNWTTGTERKTAWFPSKASRGRLRRDDPLQLCAARFYNIQWALHIHPGCSTTSHSLRDGGHKAVEISLWTGAKCTLFGLFAAPSFSFFCGILDYFFMREFISLAIGVTVSW